MMTLPCSLCSVCEATRSDLLQRQICCSVVNHGGASNALVCTSPRHLLRFMCAGIDALELHPVQAASTDEQTRQSAADRAARTVTVPARTAAVFVTPRSG